jgi:hypothetical protein
MFFEVQMQFLPGNDQIWVARLTPEDPIYQYDNEAETIAKAEELQAADPTGRLYRASQLELPVPVVEETPVVEEAPAVEEESFTVEEVPMVEETPVVVEEAVIVEETPAVEETPVVEEVPAVEEAIVIEETPTEPTPE